MTKASFRRIGRLLLAGFALALAASGGCSRMSEGERCDFTNAGDQDCDDGLVCVKADELINGGNNADRCCPPANESQSDPTCVRSTVVPGAGGSSGAGGSTGGSASGAAGESAGGMGGTPSGGEGGTPSGMAGGTSAAGMGGV
jgi:hypothetical protein